MNGAYGPFNLSLRSGDWTVLWELWLNGQIAPRVVAESAAMGVAAAAVPGMIYVALTRRRRPR
jgi:hypothetical protein